MKKVLSIILSLLMLCSLAGCSGQTQSGKLTTDADFPGISWGSSVEQVEKVYPELTQCDTGNDWYPVYAADITVFDKPAHAEFSFFSAEDRTYLASVTATFDEMSDADGEALYTKISETYADHLNAAQVTTDSLTEEQKALYDANNALLGIGNDVTHELITVNNWAPDQLQIIAGFYVLANVDMSK